MNTVMLNTVTRVSSGSVAEALDRREKPTTDREPALFTVVEREVATVATGA
ncbi:hypothetical protein OG339_24545 [Streptosporangium sp. NBC_01495]|uniref:hypothetical protein n=1 Tax=Streptosporangium sp. NBC_01495 TaxID=2903899 RepID=UPI002E2FEA78|nr:hypothetical protein [Streptosporangium sp. NBC_01495]